MLFLSSILLIVVAGCIPGVSPAPVALPVPNEPPTAYIDSISLTRIFQGEEISFNGHGTDLDGTIAAYEWRSSLDGLISTSASFETSSLSAGNNIIYFRVQDNKGVWSEEIHRDVSVIMPGTIKPMISYFESRPDIVMRGGNAELSWEVRGADIVNIDPGIGSVRSVGTRKISATIDTYVTLTAANAAGSVSEEIKITVSPVPVTTIETFSIIGEEGYVSSNGDLGRDLKVGDIASGLHEESLQAFMSFDISMIPDGAKILSASIDITSFEIQGEPFGNIGLGRLGIYHDQYGNLESADFFNSGGFATDIPIAHTMWRPVRSFISPEIARGVQRQVDVGSPRFQIRVRFDKLVNGNEQTDFIWIGKGDTLLIVTYEE